MGKLATITRRSLLLGSVAVAGGVAFGVYSYRQPYANPLEDGLAEGAAALNPYLVIDQRGVTIITPRAEMGQGVHTTLAALVAEELDVKWEDIRTEHGPADEVYFNRAAMEDFAPFAAFDDSGTAEAVRQSMGVMAKFMGFQLTGGSSTTSDAYFKMRLAGAGAREVLVEAAALKWGVLASKLETAEGRVINAATGESLSYSELAPQAALLKPPPEPKLKDKSQWRYLGKSMPRVDMLAKCTGTAEFGVDVRRENMVYATVRTNPRLGGVMLSYDANKAREMKGVQQVLDLGDGVAVVADNTWRAFKAAEAINFSWGEAPYPPTTDGIFDEIVTGFEDEADSSFRDDGDAAEALEAQPGKVISAEYRVPFLAHTAMEPINAVAHLGDNGLDIWVGHQAPTLARDQAAQAVGMDADQVRIHVMYLGGGFGRRAEIDNVVQVAKVAKALQGQTVKLTWTREEDTRHDMYRPGAVARCRGLMGEQKQPEALQMLVSSPSVARSFGARVGLPVMGPDKLITEGSSDQPYVIPHYQVRGYTPPVAVPVGSWRSVGASFNGFFHESFLDELAAAEAVDPVQMRLKMTEDYPVAHKVIKAAAELSSWGSPMEPGRGRGFAMCLSFGSYCAQVVEVSDTPEGIHIDKVFCVIDVGTALDPGNIEAQMHSGITYGLSAAIMGEITFADGAVEQSNFHDYNALRMAQTPEIVVKVLENGPKLKGVGEPGTPPSMPALANAIFAVNGRRIRELPLNRQVKFV